MPEVTRRTVMTAGLGGLGLAAVAVATQGGPALAAGAAKAAAATASADSLEAGVTPVRSLYLPAVGTAFRASDGTRTISVTLSSIADLAPVSRPDDEHRFNLLFTSVGFLTSEGIFTLRHPDVPTTTLFLSPIGPRGATRTLQAIVNRTA